MTATFPIMVRPSLSGALSRAAEVCAETIAAYRDEAAPPRDRRFVSALLLAIGALETAATADEEDGLRREIALDVAASLARDAAEAVRARGLDERLLRCAAACERAAHLCEAALAPLRDAAC